MFVCCVFNFCFKKIYNNYQNVNVYVVGRSLAAGDNKTEYELNFNDYFSLLQVSSEEAESKVQELITAISELKRLLSEAIQGK